MSVLSIIIITFDLDCPPDHKRVYPGKFEASCVQGLFSSLAPEPNSAWHVRRSPNSCFANVGFKRTRETQTSTRLRPRPARLRAFSEGTRVRGLPCAVFSR